MQARTGLYYAHEPSRLVVCDNYEQYSNYSYADHTAQGSLMLIYNMAKPEDFILYLLQYLLKQHKQTPYKFQCYAQQK